MYSAKGVLLVGGHTIQALTLRRLQYIQQPAKHCAQVWPGLCLASEACDADSGSCKLAVSTCCHLTIRTEHHHMEVGPLQYLRQHVPQQRGSIEHTQKLGGGIEAATRQALLPGQQPVGRDGAGETHVHPLLQRTCCGGMYDRNATPGKSA